MPNFKVFRNMIKNENYKNKKLGKETVKCLPLAKITLEFTNHLWLHKLSLHRNESATPMLKVSNRCSFPPLRRQNSWFP